MLRCDASSERPISSLPTLATPDKSLRYLAFSSGHPVVVGESLGQDGSGFDPGDSNLWLSRPVLSSSLYPRRLSPSKAVCSSVSALTRSIG